jgi:hypothetical protein
MLVGKFGSYTTALCPISKITTPIVDLNESEDKLPLKLLPDFVLMHTGRWTPLCLLSANQLAYAFYMKIFFLII